MAEVKFGTGQVSITGIYLIKSPDDKFYIGQTRNFKERLKTHRKKTMRSKVLDESFNKHGYAAHNIEMINELPYDVSQIHLDNHEKLYISQFKECGLELLNIQEGGLISKHAESSKKKMSEMKKGKRLSVETIEKLKQRKGWNHTDHAKAKCRASKLGKLNPCFGKRPSDFTISKLVESNKKRAGTPMRESTKKKLSEINNKVVNQYSLTGIFIKEWPSVKEAQNTLHIFNISWCAKGKLKTAGGFLWKYPTKTNQNG